MTENKKPILNFFANIGELVINITLMPTRKQWKNWSLPSKLTAIGAYVGILAFALTIISIIPRIVDIASKTPALSLPPLQELKDAFDSGKMSSTVVYLVKETGLGNTVLIEEEIKEIGPVELAAPPRDHSISCLRALKPAQFAAKSWSADSELVYVVAGASQVVHSHTKGFYYPIYRWLFVYRGSNFKFLLVGVDPGPEITARVTWTDESSETNEKTFKSFAPIDVEQWKVDSFDAVQTVLEHGAMITSGAVFLRMDEIYGQHIPTWFIAFHGTFKVNAVTGEISFNPLEDLTPSIKSILDRFHNDRGEEYKVYGRHVRLGLAIEVPPYREFDLKVDFRTRVQLTLEVTDWTSYFYYDNPIALVHGVPNAASTRRSLRSPPLAEAEVISYGDEGTKIHETHYHADGTLAYEGTITFSSKTGLKEREESVEGNKETDYYFLWPSGTSH